MNSPIKPSVERKSAVFLISGFLDRLERCRV
jgi:hypothetical protein